MEETKSMDKTFPEICVSVIIPVYDPGPGIEKCIRSLRDQTLRDIEFIFIDDLGSDDSMRAVEAFAERDKRVRIIRNEENIGAGPSRNKGIDAARGAYLSFVDPDDYIAPDFLEILYNNALHGGLDIAKGNIVYERETGEVSEHADLNQFIEERCVKNAEPLYAIFKYQHQSAIYRTQMVRDNGVRYGTARKAQDTTFLLMACSHAESFGLSNEALYYFVERGNSAMHRMNDEMMRQAILSVGEQMDYLSTSLGDDRYAPGYAIVQLVDLMKLFQHFSSLPGSTLRSDGTIERIREMSASLPFADHFKIEITLRALMEYGVCLTRSPFALPWNYPAAADMDLVLSGWASFISEHPDADPAYNLAMKEIFYGNSRTISRLCKKDISRSEKAALNNALRKAISALPPRRRAALLKYSMIRIARSAAAAPLRIFK